VSEIAHQGAYTATLLDIQDVISGEIDISPPFNATDSQGYLGFLGDLCGTQIEPFASTPNTTRLTVTIKNEGISSHYMHTAFLHTAKLLAQTLELIDKGEDIIFRDYSEAYPEKEE